MKRKTVVACDVDGCINIGGDDNFNHDDVTSQMIINDDGRPNALVTFSPTIIRALNSLMTLVPFFFLTSWNRETRWLQQVGLNKSPFLLVDRKDETTERSSKIAHIIKLAEANNVIWIDDFARDWFEDIPLDIRQHVLPIQPDHQQGLSDADMLTINKNLTEWAWGKA